MVQSHSENDTPSDHEMESVNPTQLRDSLRDLLPSEDKWDGSPFKEGLYGLTEEDPTHDKLRQFAENPNLILRKAYSEGNLEKQESRVKHFLAAIDKLKEHNIDVVEFQAILGGNKEDTNIYIAAQRVTGEKVSVESANIPKSVLIDIVQKLLLYFNDIIQNGGYYVQDISPDQFIYGTVDGDEHPKPYLVDLDPYVGELNIANPTTFDLDSLEDDIDVLERNYLPHLVLDDHKKRELYSNIHNLKGLIGSYRLNRLG